METKTYGWFLERPSSSALVGGVVAEGERCILGITPQSEFRVERGTVILRCCTTGVATPCIVGMDAKLSVHDWVLTVWEVQPFSNRVNEV